MSESGPDVQISEEDTLEPGILFRCSGGQIINPRSLNQLVLDQPHHHRYRGATTCRAAISLDARCPLSAPKKSSIYRTFLSGSRTPPPIQKLARRRQSLDSNPTTRRASRKEWGHCHDMSREVVSARGHRLESTAEMNQAGVASSQRERLSAKSDALPALIVRRSESQDYSETRNQL